MAQREPYMPFRPFGQWASGITSSPTFNDFAKEWEQAKELAPEIASGDAVRFALRSAALETGAIEGLYDVTRGVTYSVAIQAVAWEAQLSEIGDDVVSHFGAQLDAYEMVLDVAVEPERFTQSWLRQLHATTTRSQPTYRVWTTEGWAERRLEHGAYKTDPNNVTLSDGTVREYCPVTDVPAEMTRLLDESRGSQFVESPPVVQAAYFHHAFTTIHPFSDGNGRVARAASSVFLYRAAGVPLVIWADQKHRYFDALALADRGDVQPFINFIEDRALDTLGVVTRQITAARAGESAVQLRDLLQAHGGLSHHEVELVAGRLLTKVAELASERLRQEAPEGFGVSTSEKHEKCSFGGPYHSPPNRTGMAYRVSGASPVDVGGDFTPMIGIADSFDERYVYVLMDANRPAASRLWLRLDEVHPELSAVAEIKLDGWVRESVGNLIADLARGIAAGLKARGYEPPTP